MEITRERFIKNLIQGNKKGEEALVMYNLIYIIVIIIMILIGNYNFIIKKENKFVLYFLIFIFSITVGIRELSIPDTRAYYNMFKEINTNILEINYSYFEFGFIVISKIIKNLTTNVRVYFGLISVINLLLIIKNLYMELI